MSEGKTSAIPYGSKYLLRLLECVRSHYGSQRRGRLNWRHARSNHSWGVVELPDNLTRVCLLSLQPRSFLGLPNPLGHVEPSLDPLIRRMQIGGALGRKSWDQAT